jgi:hypothetical protein
MTTPAVSKAHVLRLLGEYKHVAFRVALRLGKDDEWTIHTLVIDAIPEPYTRDQVVFEEHYNLQKFVHLYPTAVFIADVEDSSKVTSWFDPSRGFHYDAPLDRPTSTRSYSATMPELFDVPSFETIYYRRAHSEGFGDGFDRMRWPHTNYTFNPNPYKPDQYDRTPLVRTPGSASRSYPDFKMALMELIYGDNDWDSAQRRSADPHVFMRVVRERPYFEDIKQTDERKVAVTVHGLNMRGAAIQLAATGGLYVDKDVFAPNTYLLELDRNVPPKGLLTLVQEGEVLDSYEWDAAHYPLPGASRASSTEPAVLIPGLDINVAEDPRVTGSNETDEGNVAMQTQGQVSRSVPIAIEESFARFRKDHPTPQKTGFIMMRFGTTAAHEAIAETIKDTLVSYNLEALRADDKEYHTDLLPNIQTYMHGCGFGIAVFERLESQEFNPNVALEVGYMLALGKPVCLLKDKTLTTLQPDLVGKLYRQFDPQRIKQTIKRELEKWLRDQGLL